VVFLFKGYLIKKIDKMVTKKHIKEYYTSTKILLPLKRPSCGNGFNSQSSDFILRAAQLRVVKDHLNGTLLQVQTLRPYQSGTLGGKTWLYPRHEVSVYLDSSSEEQSVRVDILQSTTRIVYGPMLGSRIPSIFGCFLLGIIVLFGVVYLKAQPYSIIRLLFP
jgi:hypothetical protein